MADTEQELPKDDSGFLQRLLKEGHLRELGEDPNRFDPLVRAARDIAQDLSTGPGRPETIPMVLVGLDSSAPADDPIFDRVLDSILKHWPTFSNVFKGDRPHRLLRMVAVDAVQRAAANDPHVAAAAWYTAIGMFARSQVADSGDTVSALFMSMGGMVENAAAREWAGRGQEASFRMPARTTAEAANLTPPRVRSDGFREEFVDALKTEIQHLQLRNRQGQTNAPQSWADEAAPALAAAVASAVNRGVANLVEELNGARLLSVSGVKDLAEEIGARIRAVLLEVGSISAGHERRTALLWWRQSLYSPSLSAPYREIPREQLPIVAAFDVCQLIPPASPQSVEYLLREAVGDIAGEGMIGMGDFIQTARNIRDLWKDIYPLEPIQGDRRAPLLNAALLDQTNFDVQIGLKESERLTFTDMASQAFREIQAARNAAAES